ncbi:hypothetical protein MHH67_11415 [Bacillus sp. FSL K6-0047]
MTTKPLADFNEAEMAIVYEAMQRYGERLTGADHALFKITLLKVINQENTVELDGMGMRQVNKALVARAKLHYAADQSEAGKAKWRLVAGLAGLVLARMYQFQHKNNPLLKKEEAQTAATVHASVSNL